MKPYAKNAKKHPEKQLKLIAKSLKEFGWQQPIVVDKNDEIIVGHGRWMAYTKYPEGIKEPWIKKENKLTPQQIKAYRLADNKLNESDWDMDLAIEELKELDDDLVDLTGFDTDLLIEPDDKDDEVPEVPEEPKAKIGEIYQLGNHLIMAGDATKQEDIEKLMDGKKADMVFTDPPYNIGFSYNQHKDKMEYDDYKDFCKRFFDLLDSERIVISPGPRNTAIWYEIMSFRDIGWIVDDIEEDEMFFDEGIWLKENTRSGASCFHLRSCEPIIFYGKFKKKRTFDVFKFSRKIDSKLRKAREGLKEGMEAPVKPVALIVEILIKFGYEGEIVKDVFLGNGTTLIACEKTNRICYGMELDPRYIDVIIKRWEDYTGNKAIKL